MNQPFQQPAPGQEPAKITPRATDFSAWYQDVIAAAELAESAPIRGCIILRPNGYAIWEAIQRLLDDRFKSIGIRNAYFPLFISYFCLKKMLSSLSQLFLAHTSLLVR